MKAKRITIFVLTLILLATAAVFTACGEDPKPDPDPTPAKVTLSSIAVTTPPSTTAYTEGETFDKKGMVVTATYSDGTTKAVTGYTVSPSGNLKVTDTAVTVSYAESSVTKTASVAITVTESGIPVLAGISVTTPPDKTEYYAGEMFEPAGMVITASYTADKASAVVTEYDYSPKVTLSADVTAITVTYTEDGVTKETTQPIEVTARALESIAVTTNPTKMDYKAGEWFDTAGMVVTATYDDGSSREVTDYTWKPGHGNFTSRAFREDDGDEGKDVTISYTENNVKKEAKLHVNVAKATADSPAVLRNGDRYEAEYATSITGVNANNKKGFVRPNRDCVGYMARTGNVITFTVNSDKADENVKLTVSLAIMLTNTSPAPAGEHKEVLFDSVYNLSVNGVDKPQGDLKYGYDGPYENQWFEWEEIELTIDLKKDENVIKFTVPELPADAPEGLPTDQYSCYIGANFNYIAFETESAALSYVPNFANARE